jgi:hypothetical protein
MEAYRHAYALDRVLLRGDQKKWEIQHEMQQVCTSEKKIAHRVQILCATPNTKYNRCVQPSHAVMQKLE